jgi:hypothetical protein
MYAEGHDLPNDHLKYESRQSDGQGNQVAIFAFRALQARVYGAKLEVDGQEVFVCSEIDPAKKQQRADQAKLGRAAVKFGQIRDELRGEQT